LVISEQIDSCVVGTVWKFDKLIFAFEELVARSEPRRTFKTFWHFAIIRNDDFVFAFRDLDPCNPFSIFFASKNSLTFLFIIFITFNAFGEI